MTFDVRLKTLLGEQVWTIATLMQRLEDAQAKTAELEAKLVVADAQKQPPSDGTPKD